LRQHVLDGEASRPVRETERQVGMRVAVGIGWRCNDVCQRDPGGEADRIVRPASFDDPLVALTDIDQIGIIAFATAKRVIPGAAGNRVVVECAPDIVGARGSGVVGEPEEVGPVETRSIIKLEPLDLRGGLDVGRPRRALRQHVLDGEAAGAVREAEGQIIVAVAVSIAGHGQNVREREARSEADRVV